MNKRILIVAAFMALSIKSICLAGVIEISPSQVAIITPAVGDTDLTLGPRVCLKFNLPEEISGVEIGYAELAIRLDLPAMTDDSLAIFEAFGLSSGWSDNVGWSDFSTPGGDIDSAFYSSFTYRCGSDTGVSLEIANLVKAWNDSTQANYGLIIIPRTTDFNGYREFKYLAQQLQSATILKISIPGEDE